MCKTLQWKLSICHYKTVMKKIYIPRDKPHYAFVKNLKSNFDSKVEYRIIFGRKLYKCPFVRKKVIIQQICVCKNSWIEVCVEVPCWSGQCFFLRFVVIDLLSSKGSIYNRFFVFINRCLPMLCWQITFLTMTLIR